MKTGHTTPRARQRGKNGKAYSFVLFISERCGLSRKST
jgi:hypothetical protein